MKIPDQVRREIRAKGGRASGGTRYFAGKKSGEDTMIRMMQKAINEKKAAKKKKENKKPEDDVVEKCKLLRRLLEDNSRDKEIDRMLYRLREAINV